KIYTPDHVNRVMQNLRNLGGDTSRRPYSPSTRAFSTPSNPSRGIPIYGGNTIDDILARTPPEEEPRATPPSHRPQTREEQLRAQGFNAPDLPADLRFDLSGGPKAPAAEAQPPATWTETAGAALKGAGSNLLRMVGNLAIPDVPPEEMTPAERMLREKQ